MKKLLFVICATALLGLTTACVDPVNQVRVNNPNYDPIKDAVTAQFVLNIAPADNSINTKQNRADVQVDTSFRGLGNATLFTIAIDGADGKHVKRVRIDRGQEQPQTGDTLFASSYIPLADALKAGVIDFENSRRTMEIVIPKGTNVVLFYGEAITGESDDMLNAFGGLEYTMDGKNLLSIGCGARRRLIEGTPESTDFDRVGHIILCVINHLFMTGVNFEKENDQWTEQGWENLQGTTTAPYRFKRKVDNPVTLSAADTVFGDYSLDGKQLHWKDFEQCANGGVSPLPRILLNRPDSLPTAAPLEQMLGLAYKAFVTFNPNELRAGSGPALLRQVKDLHDVVSGALLATPSSREEEVAQLIFREIDTYIHSFFVLDANNTVTAWKPAKKVTGSTSVPEILKELGIQSDLPEPSKSIYTLNDYPFHFNLPMGSVTLIKGSRADSTFVYNTKDIDMNQMGGGRMSVYDYTYPTSLVYFGNSPLRVTSTNGVNWENLPKTAATWENKALWDASPDNWVSDSHVQADTRAVAMELNIHYGCALLETKVKFASTDSLEDNNYALNGDRNKKYAIGGTLPGTTQARTLTLTGVLVGGQPSHVGWNYIPVAPLGGTLNFNRMVYDKRLNGGVSKESPSGSGVYLYPVDVPTDGNYTPSNFTTVFDNYDPDATNGQNSVYVALEFVNNLGEDFWGNANMVRNGGTFYLMGKLDLTAAKKAEFTAEKWAAAGSVMPPYYEVPEQGHNAGDTKEIVRVFMQRHTTVANFTINKKALQNAYVTVPDLRSAKMSFGLSVDLVWKPGLSFDVPLGSAN